MAVLRIVPNLPARDPAALARFWAEVLERARRLGSVPGPVDEDRGVRRFFLRDPEGNLVNILMHRGQ